MSDYLIALINPSRFIIIAIIIFFFFLKWNCTVSIIEGNGLIGNFRSNELYARFVADEWVNRIFFFFCLERIDENVGRLSFCLIEGCLATCSKSNPCNECLIVSVYRPCRSISKLSISTCIFIQLFFSSSLFSRDAKRIGRALFGIFCSLRTFHTDIDNRCWDEIGDQVRIHFSDKYFPLFEERDTSIFASICALRDLRNLQLSGIHDI